MNAPDHDDPSVLTEPTIPDTTDDPVYDPAWGVNLTYDLIAEVVDARLALQETMKALRQDLSGLVGFETTKTDTYWAIAILSLMEQRGLAPAGASESLHCIQTLQLADWLWDYITARGVTVYRAKPRAG